MHFVVLSILIIIFIHLLGYGSCEVAGDDAVALSYLIAATRPIGGILLTLLFLALLKPVIVGIIPF